MSVVFIVVFCSGPPRKRDGTSQGVILIKEFQFEFQFKEDEMRLPRDQRRLLPSPLFKKENGCGIKECLNLKTPRSEIQGIRGRSE